MSREKCLKKPFKDSLDDIKERMKEKRNKKWAKLGKTNQVLSTNCKTATNSSSQLKSFQANNRALALALQEEKAKMKEAQDTILHLKKEYQSLAFQMLVLQRQLNSQQVKEPVETRLSILREIISKVAQNLLSTADHLLGPARDLCSTDLNNKMCPSVLEGDDSSVLRQAGSLGLPTSVLVSDTSIQGESEIENYTDANHSSYSVSNSWQTFENTTSVKKTVSNTAGQSYDFHLDNLEAKLEDVPSDEEDRQFGTVLPKTVSTRRRCSNMKIHVHDLEHSERADLTMEFCKEDETRLQGSLEKGNTENTVPNLSQLNENKKNMDPTLYQADILPELNCSVAEPKLKQIQLKNRRDSQTRREILQKGKLEGTKKSSRTKPNRQRSQAKQNSKEKLDSSSGSSKAYDFHFEENVHRTPFRQNRMNGCDNDVDEKKDTCETKTHSSEASDSEENSDDSPYVPYKSISKYRKSSLCKNDRSPVRTRPQSKRCAVHQQQKNNNEETETTTSNEKIISAVESAPVDSTSMIKEINIQSITVMKADEEKSHSLPCATDTASKTDKSASSENPHCHFANGETEASQTSRLRLCDVTNISSSSGTKSRISHPFFSIEETLGAPNQKRRCTVNVNYKEPSICGKLRRGDPFTDTCFLNSPIFKQKKGPKCSSVKKELLSKYNEAFVGCR